MGKSLRDIRALLFISFICLSDRAVLSLPSVSFLRPSPRNFLEIIKGGELATDILVEIKEVQIPEDAYLIIRFGDQNVIMCPSSADSIDDCPNGEANLPSVVRLTFFGIELGPQQICAEVVSASYQQTLAYSCTTLVGSDRFVGGDENKEFFLHEIEEFLTNAAIDLFWSRLLQYTMLNQSVAVCSFVNVGDYFVVPKDMCNCSDVRIIQIRREHVTGADSFRVNGDHGSSKDFNFLPSTWALETVIPQPSGQLPLRGLLVDTSSIPLMQVLPRAATALENRAIDVVFWSAPAAENRSELLEAVRYLEGFGYHSLIVGLSRLIPIVQYMWSDVYAAPIEQGDEATGRIHFAALHHGGPVEGGQGANAVLSLLEELLGLYNSSGMIPNCRPRVQYSFHAREGYIADDCPPNYEVYKSSRLRLFESSRPGLPVPLHPHSLLRFRRNVYSECGEDGITQHLFEQLNVQQGFCFEFGAWDGVFASNCRYWIEKGWDAMLVEADSGKFKDLQRTYRNLPHIILVEAFVNASGSDSIQGLVDRYAGGQHVDLLSIDVDGLDYELLKSIAGIPPAQRPSVILVECNGFIRPDLQQVLDASASAGNLQQSLHVFRTLAIHLGYRMVAFTQNAVLVRMDLASGLPVESLGPDSVNRLYLDALTLNWNDLLINIAATRRGAPEALVKAEMEQFGEFEAEVDFQALLARAESDEARLTKQYHRTATRR